MKIQPALCPRHEPEQRHSTERLEEKLPVKNEKKTKKKTNTKYQSPQRTKGRAAPPDLPEGTTAPQT
jgi:hypothetical protein